VSVGTGPAAVLEPGGDVSVDVAVDVAVGTLVLEKVVVGEAVVVDLVD
jgi:hypothetical protein